MRIPKTIPTWKRELNSAQDLIARFSHVDRTIAEAIASAYWTLVMCARKTPTWAIDHGAGKVIRKHQSRGFHVGVSHSNGQLANVAAVLLDMDPALRRYPYPNAAMSILTDLVEAYDKVDGCEAARSLVRFFVSVAL